MTNQRLLWAATALFLIAALGWSGYRLKQARHLEQESADIQAFMDTFVYRNFRQDDALLRFSLADTEVAPNVCVHLMYIGTDTACLGATQWGYVGLAWEHPDVDYFYFPSDTASAWTCGEGVLSKQNTWDGLISHQMYPCADSAAGKPYQVRFAVQFRTPSGQQASLSGLKPFTLCTP